MDKNGELSLVELYGLIRGQIDHEDDLVSQRVLWALLTQAFFFGAYVGLLNAPLRQKILYSRHSRLYSYGFRRLLRFLQGCSPMLVFFHR